MSLHESLPLEEQPDQPKMLTKVILQLLNTLAEGLANSHQIEQERGSPTAAAAPGELVEKLQIPPP
jgi:hypothetical protein